MPQWRRILHGAAINYLDEDAQLAILADVALGGEELAVSRGAGLLLVRRIVQKLLREAAADESAADAGSIAANRR